MCTHRDFIQNGTWSGREGWCFYQQNRPQMGAVCYLRGLQIPNTGDIFLALSPYFVPPTYYYPTTSLLPVTLKTALETPHSSFFSVKLAFKVLGTDSLNILARQKDPQYQESTFQRRQFRKHSFSPHYSSILKNYFHNNPRKGSSQLSSFIRIQNRNMGMQ